jgi:hypothetical protein
MVFEASEGRCGFPESACRDYACFASPIIGAAYHYRDFEAAARRIASRGYETTITLDGAATTIAPPAVQQRANTSLRQERR